MQTSIQTFTFATEIILIYNNGENLTVQEFAVVFCNTGLQQAFERAFANQLRSIEISSSLEVITGQNENDNTVKIQFDDCNNVGEFVILIVDRRLSVVDERRRLDDSSNTINDTTFNYTIIFEGEVEQDGNITAAEAIAAIDSDFNGTEFITDAKSEIRAIGNDTDGTGFDVLSESEVDEIDSSVTSFDPTAAPTIATAVSCTSDLDCDYGQFCDFNRRRARSLLFGAYYTTGGVCSDL